MKIGIIKSSLPTYFPQKYNVFERCIKAIQHLAKSQDIIVKVADTIPMNAEQTQHILNQFTAENIDFILLVHGGFTMGDVARQIAISPFDVGIWATHEPTLTGDVQLNNFVSLNMSISLFKQHRDCKTHPITWFYGEPEDTTLHREISQNLKALKVKYRLQHSKIGLIGNVAPTFYNMQINQATLKQHLGINVEDIDMHTLLQRMDCVWQDEINTEISVMRSHIDFSALSNSQIAQTVHCIIALRHIAQDGGYDGLAVSDWPVLQNPPYNMHPGGAFSWLEYNDKLPIASEGDVMGVITQLIVQQITDVVGCVLDMTLPQFDNNRILIWHGGGGSLSFANNTPVPFVPHPMIGRGTPAQSMYGAIADFEFSTGQYGLCRLSDNGKKMWAINTEIVPVSPKESGYTGCRGWASNFSDLNNTYTAKDMVQSVFEHGIEHHFILAPGGIYNDLQCVAKWCNITDMKHTV